MTNKKFSDFSFASNAHPIILVGLQSGGNVQVDASPLARAMQDAFNLSFNFVLAGNLTAANLSGTNTGDQPPLGLTLVLQGASATMARFTSNRITAASVALTTPANPSDGDVIVVTVEDTGNTGCSLVANVTPSGWTIEGLSTFNLTILPCSFWFQANLSAKKWFCINYRLGAIV